MFQNHSEIVQIPGPVRRDRNDRERVLLLLQLVEIDSSVTAERSEKEKRRDLQRKREPKKEKETNVLLLREGLFDREIRIRHFALDVAFAHYQF